MSPTYWESKALLLYPRKAWFAVATAVGMLMFIGAGFFLPVRIAQIFVAISFSVIVSAWGLFCVCYWFEPSKGSLRSDSWMGRHLPPINLIARWWFAIMIVLFFVAGIVGPVWWLIGAGSA